MSQQNILIIRSMYEAFSHGDMQAVLAQLDECVEWVEAENFIYADRSPYVGPQAVFKGVFMRLRSEWENFAIAPEQWLDADNNIVVLGTEGGRYRATGKKVCAQFAHVWTLRDNRVIRFREFTDTRQFADAAS